MRKIKSAGLTAATPRRADFVSSLGMPGGRDFFRLEVGIGCGETRALKFRFDILGLGSTAVDELVSVEHFPEPDSNLRISSRIRQCGGLTATALMAAARMGARCAYAGVLGEDPDSKYVLEVLDQEGIHVRHARRRSGARPVRSFIIVDQRAGTRTILYDIKGVMGASPKFPSERLIASSRVLFVDRFGMAGMLRAARIARAAGRPVVGDFQRTDIPRLGQLMELVDHLIVPHCFAASLTGSAHPAHAVRRLLERGHSVAVVTKGEQGCWYQTPHMKISRHIPAFQVRTVDTTGCGDVFHGAYAAALAEGREVEDRLLFATAAAALKATKSGNPDGIPQRATVESFIQRHAR